MDRFSSSRNEDLDESQREPILSQSDNTIGYSQLRRVESNVSVMMRTNNRFQKIESKDQSDMSRQIYASQMPLMMIR